MLNFSSVRSCADLGAWRFTADAIITGWVIALTAEKSSAQFHECFEPKFSDWFAQIVIDLIGRGGGIRTRDPLHPMQVRYQAAPRPDELQIISEAWRFDWYD